jgi:hypothetical protein
VLPDILNTEATKPLLQGEDFAQRVAAALERAGGISADHIAAVTERLTKVEDSHPGAIADKLREGSPRFAEELTKDIIHPLGDALTRIARDLQQQGAALVQGLATYQEQQRHFLESQTSLDNLRLHVERDAAARFAEAIGRPSSTLDFLPLSSSLAPFRQSQERLTGFAGEQALDPAAIGARLRAVIQEAEITRQRRDQAAPGGEQFAALATKLSDLQGKAVSLRDALAGLADASKQNAAIQERLARLDQERSQRLSLGERLLTGGPQEAARLSQGAVVAATALRSPRGFAGFAPIQVQQAVSFLDATKNIPLHGLGGFEGGDLKDLLIRRALPGIAALPRDVENQRTNLQDLASENIAKAAAAQKELVETQKGLQSSFFSELQATNTTFLSELRSALTAVEANKERTRLSELSVEQGKAVALSKQADQLRAAGVTEQALPVLRTNENLSLLDRFAALTGDAERLNKILNNGTIANSGVRVSETDFRAAPSYYPFNLSPPQARPESANRVFEELRAKNIPVEPQDVDAILSRIAKNPSRGALARATTEVLTEKVSGKDRDAADIRRDLGQKTGLDSPTLDKILAAVASDRGDIVKALRSVDSMERIAADIRRIADTIAATKGNIERLQPESERPDFVAITRQAANPYAGLGTYKAAGGVVQYRQTGGDVTDGPFKPKGTDTVPAMLTPGEFVVRREAAEANLSLLDQINKTKGPVKASELAFGGMPIQFVGGANVNTLATGGPVRYLEDGGPADRFERIPRPRRTRLNPVERQILETQRRAANFIYGGLPGDERKQQRAIQRRRPLPAAPAAPSGQIAIQRQAANFIYRGVTEDGPLEPSLSRVPRSPVIQFLPSGLPRDQLTERYPGIREFDPSAPISRAEAARRYPGIHESDSASPLSPEQLARKYPGIKEAAPLAPTSPGELAKRYPGIRDGSAPAPDSPELASARQAKDDALAKARADSGNPELEADAQAKYRQYLDAKRQADAGPLVEAQRRAANPYQGIGEYGPPTLQDALRRANGAERPQGASPFLPDSATPGFAMGGTVPGYSLSDTVPAMLRKGEGVLTPEAVAAVGGPGAIHSLNRVQRFAAGGVVGGQAGNGPALDFSGFQSSASQLSASITQFVNKSAELSQSLSQIGNMKIELSGHHSVEVIHNGVEAFAKMTPAIQEMVTSGVNEAIQKVFRDHLQDAYTPGK